MKIVILVDEVREVQVSGSFKTKAFSINADAKAFLILADRVYTNKVKAVVREISCNAHDSHVEAKNSGPFDVHLPTSLESWFSVRDYGTGISHEQMFSLYSEAFTSTRNKSNLYTGSLGIGRLSCYSICESFTVISFYEGLKSTYSIYKDANGIPQIALLSQEVSDEPSGLLVSVTVPSHRRQEFETEAVNVYKHFAKLPNINLKSISDRIKSFTYNIIGTDFSITKNAGVLYAVMGNVAYEVPREFNPSQYNGIIRFELGELNFDPGREKLSLDENTKRNVKDKIAKVNAELANLIFDKIDAEPTVFKKRLKYFELSNGVFSNILYSTKFDNFRNKKCSKDFIIYRAEGRRTRKDNSNVLSLECCDYFLLKEGFHARVVQFCKESNDSAILLTKEQIDELQIDPEFIRDLEDLPKVTRGPSTRTPTDGISRLGLYGRIEEIETVPDGPKVFLEICRNKPVDPSVLGLKLNSVKEHINNLKDKINFPSDIYLVKTAVTKTSKFRRAGWISLRAHIQAEVSKLPQNIKYEYGGRYTYLFEGLYKFNKDFYSKNVDIVNFIEKIRLNRNSDHNEILEMYHYYDKAQIDKSLDELEKVILDIYPLLKLLDPSDFYGRASEQAQFRIITSYLTK